MKFSDPGCPWKVILGAMVALTGMAGAADPGFDQGGITRDNPLAMPAVGDHGLRVLTPEVLELTLISTKRPDAAVEQWDFVAADGTLRLPDVDAFLVTVDGAAKKVKSAG